MIKNNYRDNEKERITNIHICFNFLLHEKIWKMVKQ